MDKIPVGRTIGQAYGFAFRRYLPLLGIVWLPLLAIGVFGYFVMMPFYQNLPHLIQTMAHNEHNPEAIMEQFNGTFRWMGLFNLLLLAVFAILTVGVTREALGLRKGPRFVYLGVGAAELRVIGSYFILVALSYIAMIVVFIVGAIVGAIIYAVASGASATHLDPKSMAAWAVAAVIAFIAAVLFASIYFIVRFSYLNVPVIVAEQRIGLIRSWELTRGNFWRIIAISIAVFLPLIAVELVAIAVAFGTAFVQFVNAVHKNPAASAENAALLMKGFVRFLPYFWGVGFVLAPIFYGLTLSPAAFAYRALMPEASLTNEGSH